jgi:predicted Zn-dependent peptidase
MMNAVLGEGMSSRLFLELREKRGLTYDVHSYDANYADAGHLVIYAGFAPQNGAEVLKAIMREVARLREGLVPDVEIERVRDFAKGRLELRLEDTRGVSGWLAGQELFLGRVRSVEEVSAIIDGVTPADIQRVAREYLRPELAYVAAIGPRASLAAITPPLADEIPVVMAS